MSLILTWSDLLGQPQFPLIISSGDTISLSSDIFIFTHTHYYFSHFYYILMIYFTQIVFNPLSHSQTFLICFLFRNKEVKISVSGKKKKNWICTSNQIEAINVKERIKICRQFGEHAEFECLPCARQAECQRIYMGHLTHWDAGGNRVLMRQPIGCVLKYLWMESWLKSVWKKGRK